MQARTLRELKTVSTGSIEFVADSIQFRPDVTRLYGKLKGKPHTANRIDEMTITYGKISQSLSDIDGVDFKRYFQWEDDGLIPVEIDFPVHRPETKFTIKLNGPRGESSWTVNATGKSRDKSKGGK